MNKVINLVLIVGSMALLGGACYKTIDTKNTNVEVNTNVSNVNTSANTNSSTVDTSDWSTYTNEEYGFSFRYPSEYTVSVREHDRGDDLIGDVGMIFVIGNAGQTISLVLYDHSIDFPTVEKIEQLQVVSGGNFFKVYKQEKVNIRDYRGIVFYISNLNGGHVVGDDEDAMRDLGRYYYLESKDRSLQIRMKENTADFFDEVLSSIQF